MKLIVNFEEMEIAGLAVGVAGLVGLFSVCRDAIEHIDTYQSFGLESRSIKVRFELSKQIFRRWADDVRITDIEMSESHHPYLDNPEIASVVRETLVSIGEIFHVTVNSSLALRLGLTDNNLLSSTSDLGVLSKKSRHHKSLQVSSKRDKIAWMLGGKNNFVKQVDAFGDLVEKLCTLVPTQHVDSRLSELGVLFESFHYRLCHVPGLITSRKVEKQRGTIRIYGFNTDSERYFTSE